MPGKNQSHFTVGVLEMNGCLDDGIGRMEIGLRSEAVRVVWS
jgi:hypothetical protein